jgi:hypothetical protein
LIVTSGGGKLENERQKDEATRPAGPAAMKRITVTITLVRRKIVHFDDGDHPQGTAAGVARLAAAPDKLERFRYMLRRLVGR